MVFAVLGGAPRGAARARCASQRTFNFHPIAYIEGMAKAKVTFKPIRIADDNWTIQADYPGTDPREITGFSSKSEIDEWMNGDRRIAWLRSQGYAK